jgi:hypothetical protein
VKKHRGPVRCHCLLGLNVIFIPCCCRAEVSYLALMREPIFSSVVFASMYFVLFILSIPEDGEIFIWPLSKEEPQQCDYQ